MRNSMDGQVQAGRLWFLNVRDRWVLKKGFRVEVRAESAAPKARRIERFHVNVRCRRVRCKYSSVDFSCPALSMKGYGECRKVNRGVLEDKVKSEIVSNHSFFPRYFTVRFNSVSISKIILPRRSSNVPLWTKDTINSSTLPNRCRLGFVKNQIEGLRSGWSEMTMDYRVVGESSFSHSGYGRWIVSNAVKLKLRIAPLWTFGLGAFFGEIQLIFATCGMNESDSPRPRLRMLCIILCQTSEKEELNEILKSDQ
jgi:hypothetical protein